MEYRLLYGKKKPYKTQFISNIIIGSNQIRNMYVALNLQIGQPSFPSYKGYITGQGFSSSQVPVVLYIPQYYAEINYFNDQMI